MQLIVRHIQYNGVVEGGIPKQCTSRKSENGNAEIAYLKFDLLHFRIPSVSSLRGNHSSRKATETHFCVECNSIFGRSLGNLDKGTYGDTHIGIRGGREEVAGRWTAYEYQTALRNWNFKVRRAHGILILVLRISLAD